MPFLYDPSDADFALEESSASWSQETSTARVDSNISTWMREVDQILSTHAPRGGPVRAISAPSSSDTLHEDMRWAADQLARRPVELARRQGETTRRQLQQAQRWIEHHEREIERLQSQLEAQRQAAQARREVGGSQGGL